MGYPYAAFSQLEAGSGPTNPSSVSFDGYRTRCLDLYRSASQAPCTNPVRRVSPVPDRESVSFSHHGAGSRRWSQVLDDRGSHMRAADRDGRVAGHLGQGPSPAHRSCDGPLPCACRHKYDSTRDGPWVLAISNTASYSRDPQSHSVMDVSDGDAHGCRGHVHPYDSPTGFASGWRAGLPDRSHNGKVRAVYSSCRVAPIYAATPLAASNSAGAPLCSIPPYSPRRRTLGTG